MRIATALLAATAAALLGGCGDGKDGAVVVYPATGRVMYDGKPAAGVEITFIPTDAPTVPTIPRNPHAVTKADGTFALTTFADGDGAAEGGYQVVLTWPPDKNRPAAKMDKADSTPEEGEEADQLLGWYDALHSNFNVRLKAEPNALPTFDLPKKVQMPQPSQGVPGRN